MNLSKLLKQLDFSVQKELFIKIKKDTNEIALKLNREIKKRQTKGSVFVGGSFAKGTISKSKEYDIDIFVRFENKNKDISKELEKIINKAFAKSEYKIEKVHGSRDYFRL